MNDSISYVSLDSLLLDPDNPRLPQVVARDQRSMLEYIAKTASIEELMGAIAENDYFSAEPLVVVPHGDKYIVVEGNRRLTALTLLNRPEATSEISQRAREISSTAKFKPTVLPVVVKKNRADVLPYLGFRHITGVKQWESLAKARYLEQLFSATSDKKEANERYYEVARSIGSRRDFVQRNLDALAVYKVMESSDFFGIEDLNETTIKFAVLSTAIANSKISQFVGVTKISNDGETITNNPILNAQAIALSSAEEIARWLFEKDEKGETRVGESRNIKKLAAIISSPKALEAFRSKASLDLAYQYTSDLSEDFSVLLNESAAKLSEAASMVASTDFSELAFEAAKRIKETIALIGRELQEKKKKQLENQSDVF